MRWAQRTPELFSIVPGYPRTINGEPTEARIPQDAIDHVFSVATWFPAQPNVRQGEQLIALEMDRRGRIQSIPAAPDATPDAGDQQTVQKEPAPPPAAPVVASAAITPAKPTLTPSTPIDSVADLEEPDRLRWLITPKRVAGAVALVAVLGIGGTLAQKSDDEQGLDGEAQEPTETPDGWMLPKEQDVIGIIGDRIITAEGTTVRLPDVEPGEEDRSMADVDNTVHVRSIDGTTASAMDTEAGQVAMLRDGEVSVVRGAFNAKGAGPVIANELECSGPDGTTGSPEDTQVVLAATPEGVVLLQSLDEIVTEGITVELASPEVDAAITQAIRAIDDRAFMVRSRGNTRWLTTHELSFGEVQFQDDIGAAEVTVRSGIAWIGSNQVLTGDEILPACDGGEQVTATILCLGSKGWESADGTQHYPKRPDAISPSYTVTAGIVTTQRNDR